MANEQKNPLEQPVMSAQQVQDTLGVNQPAAAPALSGVGQAGSGNWYSLMKAGGPAAMDAAAFQAAGPGAYNNVYAGQMQQGMNNLLNMKPFQYDVNADGLYQQIKDNYIKQGRQAMMDTQGQSAALTGGYGNSYGVQAGQQAYQESLGNLAGMIPQLADAAYGRYRDQISDQRANLEAMRQLENQDYTRWLNDQEEYQKVLKELPAAKDEMATQIAAQIAAQMRGQYEGLLSGKRTTQGAIDLDDIVQLETLRQQGLLTNEQLAAMAPYAWGGVDNYTRDMYIATHPEIAGINMDKPAYAAASGSYNNGTQTNVPPARTGAGTAQPTAQQGARMTVDDVNAWAMGDQSLNSTKKK
jgi:hypothetical protein